MRKFFTFFIFAAITIFVIAFQTDLTFTVDPKGTDENYDIAKKNFFTQYQNWKIASNNTKTGYVPVPPVDATGTFFVDKNGNFSLIDKKSPNMQILPPPHPMPNAVSGYTFAQTSGSYTSISSTGTLIAAGPGIDDQTYLLNIGFTYTFNGTAYTQMYLDANGYIDMGSTIPTTTYANVLADASNFNLVCAMERDLYANTAGSGLYYQLTGVAPNRVFTVEWLNFGVYNFATQEYNFQMKFYETTNNFQVIFGPFAPVTAGTVQCGLKGSTNADFNSRTTATNWTATTAGVLNTDNLTIPAATNPPSGQTWTWTPPVASNMTYTSSNTVQINNGVGTQAIPSGTLNTVVLQIPIITSGTLNPFTITGFNLGTNGSTNPATDITNAKIYYTGNSSVFATTTLYGTAVAPSGTFSISGSQVLAGGTDYFWLTYDVPGTATYLDVLDAQCNSITGSGTMGTVTPTTVAPAGNRFVDKYCDGLFTTNSFPFGIYLTNVTFAGNSQNSGYDPNTNFPYAYSFYQSPVPNVSQGTTYSFSASINSSVNAQGISVYIDWNQNGSFTDAGEYYNLGVIPSGGTATITGNILVPLGATLGNTRMRVRDNFSTAPLATDACTTTTYGEIEDYTINVTAATNMAYSSSTATQNVVTSFCSPQSNLQILGLQIVTTGALSPLNATSFTLNTNGSTAPPTDITNAKLWYTGLSSTFATTTQFGGTFNNPNGSFIINGSQTLQAGTNYFWLTYDVPSSGTVGDFLDGEFNSVTVGGTPFTPTTQAPAGNRQLTCTALCGTYSIPSAQFPTIASAITALNTQGISCSVIFNVAAGYTETAANLQLNTTGTASNTITFRKSGSGANPVINAGSGISTINDAFIKFNGVNYVTFDGIDLAESAGNVTTTTQMEFGYFFMKPDGTHGNSNNTIKNCNITLNKTNTATFGIYLSNVNSSNISQIVTSTAGASSNNTFLNNNLSNCYDGYYVFGYADVSPFTFYDQNNTISGGSVSNFGGTAATAYGVYCYYQNNMTVTGVNVNGTLGTIANSLIYGMYMGLMNNSNLTISNNTVSLATNVVSASVYGMFIGAGSTGTSNNVNVTGNTVQNCNLTAMTTGLFYGIYTGFTCNNMTISGNRVIGNNIGTAGLTTTSSLYLMYNANSAISTITYTNNLDSANVVNGTSAYVTYCMYNGVSTNAAVLQGNRIVNNTLCGTTATGTTYGLYNSSGTFSCNYTGNSFSNNAYPSTSTQSSYMLYNTSVAPTEDMSSNFVLNNSGTGSGTFYHIYFSASPVSGSTVNIQNNIISGTTRTTATGTGSNYGIYHGGSGAGTINITGNSVTNWTSAAATLYAGIYQIGSPPNFLNINNNTINNFTNAGATTIYGIYNNPTSTTQEVESGNTVSNITTAGSTVYGMYILNGLYATLSKNQIFGINSNTSTTAIVYGMYESISLAGANIYIYNNFISDLRTPASTSTAPAITGIYIPSGSATTNVYVFYNTVYLNATSTSLTTFGTAALYALTTPYVELRNNCLVDMSTPGPTGGNACAYRRSSTIITTYGAPSNNNCLYAGVPAINHLIYYDLTNSDQTLAAFKNRVTPRDQVSITENPPFVNVSSTPYNLHINTSIPTGLESGGQVISSPISVITDFDAQNRYPNAGYPVGGFPPIAPDIGADEFGGLNVDNVPPMITYAPLGPGGTTNRPFNNVSITDASGVNVVSGTKPRCYYKRSTDGNTIIDNTNGTDGWKYVESNGTTTPFDFTIDYSKLNGGTGVVAGNIVQYFVIAQDLAGTPNVGWNAGTMTVNPTTVNLTAANTPIGSTGQYTIVSSVFSGGYDVGTGWPYPTLTGLGGLFAAINAGVVGGNITAYIHTDITEPGTNQLNQTTEQGAGGYSITIVPFDATLKTISGSVASAMITLNGADRIVIDGNGGFDASGKRIFNGNNSDIKGLNADGRGINISGKDAPAPNKYLLFRNTNGSNPTFSFINDARNNNIKNCYIESNNISTLTTTAGTIFFGTTTGTQGNDSNTIFQCDIRDRSDAAGTPAFAIYCNGTTTNIPTFNSYDVVSNCNIYNYFYDASVFQGGVYLNAGATDWTITGNSFYQTTARNILVSASTFASIYNNNSANCINMQITNNYIGGSAPLCGGLPMTYTGATAYTILGIQGFVSVIAPEVISGNTIQNINITFNSATVSTNFFKAIYAQTGWINVTNNTIGSTTGTGNITITQNTTATANAATGFITHLGFGVITGNTIGSITIAGNSTELNPLFTGIYWSNTTAGQTYLVDNNLIGSLTTANSIQLTNQLDLHQFRAIYFTNGAGTTNIISNNTIANITSTSTSATNGCFLYGINNNGAAGNYNFTNNTIRNLTINNNALTAGFLLLGINSTGAGFNNYIQNTVNSLYSLGTGGANLVGGLLAGGTTGGTVTRNKIYDLTTNGTGSSAPAPIILGINCQSTGQYNLNNNMICLTNGDASDYHNGKTFDPDNFNFNKVETRGYQEIKPSSTALMQKDNNIPADKMSMPDASKDKVEPDGAYDEKTSKISHNNLNKEIHQNLNDGVNHGGPKSNSLININIAGVYHTNTGPGTQNYFYNTFYIGGSQPGGTYNSWCFVRTQNGALSFKNNLFVNNRTGGAGNQYCLGNEAPTPSFGWTSASSNYNTFLPGNDNTVAEWGTGNAVTIAGLRASTGGDNQSWETNTSTINPANLFVNIASGNLHINNANIESWLVSGKGIALSGYNVDFDGQSRATTISGGCTDIGADEFANPVVNPPVATESSAPAGGTTSTYTLWGRTLATIDWGNGGTSYPSQMYLTYFSGVSPTGVLGGNYSNSNSTLVPRSGSLAGTTYNITYYFGDNETYTITSPSTNTLLAKYNPSSWEVFQPGNGVYQTQLTYNTSSEIYTAKVIGLTNFSTFALTDITAPLPVMLSSFSASTSSRNVSLQWTTSREVNNQGFDVERRMQTDPSQNAFSPWTKAGYVRGHGNSNENQNYSFTDTKLVTGKYQYRLKQIDFNGNYEYFGLHEPEMVDVSKPGSSDLSQNYPNPSNPKSKIDYQIPFDGKVSLKVYDVTGREITTIVNELKQAGYYTAEFDGTNLASGVYFYRLIAESTTGQNFAATKKMVLVK